MARGWVWLQLSIAWLPMWALFAAIIVIVHGNSLADAAIGSLRMVGPGAVLGIAVYKFASRLPWPHPFRLAFVRRLNLAKHIRGLFQAPQQHQRLDFSNAALKGKLALAICFLA